MAQFGYSRVSTLEQNTTNQRMELEKAGYAFDYWYADTGISGKTAASQRPEFKKLLEKIRDGETLVVSKLDRLGRDAIDVLQTVRMLEDRKVKVIVLQVGDMDLTSPAGRMLLTMLAAVAQMERDLLIERTQAGLARAKAEGKKLGRPSKTTQEQRKAIVDQLGQGESVSALARQYGVARANIINIRREAAATVL